MDDRILLFLARLRVEPGAALKLQGDASTRAFYRVPWRGGTAVLMVYGKPGEISEEAYCGMTAFYRRVGIAVPELYERDPDLGCLLLEDLGDRSLRAHLDASPSGARAEAFRDAVRLIARIQREGTAALDPSVPAARVRFDTAVFLRELRFFHAHFFHGLCPVAMTEDTEQALDRFYEEVSRSLSSFSSVLCHRDYHMDNIHVRRGRLYIIDFQDSRIGPAAYDLASLLKDRDVNAFLDDDTAQAMARFYMELAGVTEAEFRRQYDLAVVQRCIKALGTFAYQAGLGRARYLAYVNPTLSRVHAALSAAPGLPPGAAALAERLPRALP